MNLKYSYPVLFAMVLWRRRLAARLRLGSLLVLSMLSIDLGPLSAGGVVTFTWRALRGSVAYLSSVFCDALRAAISWRA
jgi:hypothetical protein